MRSSRWWMISVIKFSTRGGLLTVDFRLEHVVLCPCNFCVHVAIWWVAWVTMRVDSKLSSSCFSSKYLIKCSAVPDLCWSGLCQHYEHPVVTCMRADPFATSSENYSLANSTHPNMKFRAITCPDLQFATNCKWRKLAANWGQINCSNYFQWQFYECKWWS